MRLIRKYRLRGYGLYFALVESIAYQLTSTSPTPDLEETAKDVADFFGEDTLFVEEVIKYCIEQGLFEYSQETGRLICMKMLTHLDNTMSNNPEIRAIMANFQKVKETSIKLKKPKADQIRSDQPRSDQISDIYTHWNAQGIVKHQKITDAIQRKIRTKLKEHSEGEIREAITNYANIVHSRDHYFSHKWILADFLQRGLEKFLDWEICYTNYLSNKPKTREQTVMEELDARREEARCHVDGPVQIDGPHV